MLSLPVESAPGKCANEVPFHMGPFEVGLFTNYFRHVICPYLYTGSQPSATL